MLSALELRGARQEALAGAAEQLVDARSQLGKSTCSQCRTTTRSHTAPTVHQSDAHHDADRILSHGCVSHASTGVNSAGCAHAHERLLLDSPKDISEITGASTLPPGLQRSSVRCDSGPLPPVQHPARGHCM